MFCRKNQWEGTKFPRELFHDSKSKRGGVLMHTKMIIGTFNRTGASRDGRQRTLDSEDEDFLSGEDELEVVASDVVGWAYVGSHNFTPSAWGNLSGSASNPSLNIVNFELGVVFPLKSEKEIDNVACWERPPRKYNLKKDRAWIQEEVLPALLGGV